MLALELREVEDMADVDENGLETIDLTDDIGATSGGQLSREKPQPSVLPSSSS